MPIMTNSNYESAWRAAYNGFVFDPEYTVTKGFSLKPVPDRSGRTTMYDEYTITLETQILASSTSLTVTDARQRLSKSGADFYYKGRGLGDIELNIGGSSGAGIGGGILETGGAGGGNGIGGGSIFDTISSAFPPGPGDGSAGSGNGIPSTGGGSGTSVVRDVNYGPKVQLLDFKVLGPGNACRLTWTVTVCIPDGAYASYAFALMALNFQVEFRLRRNGKTDRVITGDLMIPNNRTGPNARTILDSPDNYREQIVTPVPTGFWREWQPWVINEARTAMTFGWIDHEFDGEIFPFGCVSAKFAQTTRTVGKGLVTAQSVFRGEYELAPGYDATVAEKAFFDVVNDRLMNAEPNTEDDGTGKPRGGGSGLLAAGVGVAGAALGGTAVTPIGGSVGGIVDGILAGVGVGGSGLGTLVGVAAGVVGAGANDRRGWIPMEFVIEEPDLYGPNIIGFNFTAMLFRSTLRTILSNSGIWSADPNSNWQSWSASLADSALHPRGCAKLTFTTNEDRIIDLLGNEQNGRAAGAKTPKQLALSGNIPDPNAAWIDYQNHIFVENDAGTAELRTLPLDDITPDDNTAGNIGGELISGGLGATLTTPDATLFSGGNGMGGLPGPGGIDPGFGGSSGDDLPDGAPTASEGFSAAFGDLTPLDEDDPFPVQHRTRQAGYVIMHGTAMRAGLPIPCPELKDVEGQKPTPANRLDCGEGFNSGIIRNAGSIAIYGATWRLRYFLKEIPDKPINPPPNPMYGGSQ